MVTLVGSVPNSHPINSLYIFGDSLSDVGNVFRATGGLSPASPPYFQGRYSNGRIWVEYLATKLTLTPEKNTNFAYGGATTGNSQVNGIPGLLAQVVAFTNAHKSVNPQGLYILWAGANDYLQGAANPIVPVENLSKAMQLLATAGAKKILVANLPDLGQLPATRPSSFSSFLSALAREHNLSLAKSVEALRQKFGPDFQLVELDVYSLYQEAITNPAKFGLTTVTSACLAGANLCGNPERFLFWDGIHPTTVAHQILGEKAFSLMAGERELSTHH